MTGPKLTDEEKAIITMYRALNLNQREIMERTGRSQGAITDHLTTLESRVEDGEEPFEVFAEQVEALLEVRAVPRVRE